MTKVEEALKKVKEIFTQLAAPAPIPAAQVVPAPAGAPAGNASNTAQYNVDGGAPVFVNISDDGIAGIDAGDPVFTDAAMTIPYPDGTYKVTGTDFSFTVAAGSVSAVTDPDQKGAGTPVQAAAAPVVPAPVVPAPAPAAKPVPNFSTQENIKKELEAFNEKFSNGGTPDLESLAIITKALFENVFGWQLQEAQRKADQEAAMQTYLQNFTKQEGIISKQKEALDGLLSVVEELSKVPTDNPVDEPKTIFGKKDLKTKEERMSRIVSEIKELRTPKTA
jgi:hypothetical protein